MIDSENFDIYLTGVGGQGIGLLSEVLLRALDHAGKRVLGVDTHGLAQRGGVVVSNIRVGEKMMSPLIRESMADMVISLERYEAYRATMNTLKTGGTLVYYDTVIQPLGIRLENENPIDSEDIARLCEYRKIDMTCIENEDLEDPRTQNTVILAALCREKMIPGLEAGHMVAAMGDLLQGSSLEHNIELFRKKALCDIY
ncbi:MAG: pyruvate ferredoxin oxidoreductase [Candidatus Wallbacteria bacterium HGW-Wallbacteria-1]|jgi:indolepyruvate ferredoxin oxidoreductase beta subunit|uniref:Pyruvate ferredoxin oxidoreductase n=1 Tax=Candidatus Wallbacteria bacterium HGW-Wallbacteria-1 TaxID=2013854 RepID=A0A2N1PMS3_9BACT|nr:MAG: pyruvate ferredoxin oxidoreductase [Candidatus Wallbacteria bacterium HGW-Wallbacteria-1]